MDTARKFRLLQLLDAKASEYVGRLDELKYLIAPFIAQNDKQQARFYEIFEEFLAECEEEALPEFIQPDSFWKRNKILLLSTGLVLCAIIVLALLFGRAPAPEVAVPVKMEQLKGSSYSVSDTLALTNQTIQQPGDSGKFIWEVLDPLTKQVLYSSTDQQLQWLPDTIGEKFIRLSIVEPDTTRFAPGEATTTVSIICDEPPAVNRTDISPAEGGSMVQGSVQAFEFRKPVAGDSAIWIFSNGDTLHGAKVSHELSESASQTTVRLQVKRGEFCLTEISLNYSLGKDKPFLSLLQLKELEPPISHRLNFWYWLLVLLPLVALPWLYRRWSRQFRREELVVEKTLAELNEQYPVQDRDPYYIPYRDHRDQIQVPPLFFRIADVLRRREDGFRTEFDSKKSVAATVKAGGFPSWQDRNLSRPTAYLVLIQWHEERHQQDRLLHRLVSFLREQDAPVTVLWHDGSFEQVWESTGEVTDLGHWKRNHPAHRLIILGDAAGLQNRGMTPEPMLIQRRLSTLLDWERRLILTTRPASDWGWQEALLHEHFLLYPVTSQGILDGVEALDRIEEYTAGDVSLAFREAKLQYPETSVQYEALDTLEGLQTWLQDDPDVYRWLCGLAVTANPDWSLTVAIGRALGIDVTHDRLLRLSRIPWLASNQPHNGLRINLLRALGAEDTAIARQTMIEELEAVKEQTEGGYAEVEWTATMAVQHFALDPALPAHKQQIRELQAVGILPMEQEAELEFIVREQTEGTGFSEETRTSLTAWLEAPELPQPIRWWTRESMLAIILLLLSILAGVFGLRYNLSQPAGKPNNPLQSEIVKADSSVLMVNTLIDFSRNRDSLESWSQWMTTEDTLRAALGVIEGLFAPNLDSINSKKYDSALFTILYNYKVKAFNFFLADSADLMTDLRALNIGGDTIFKMQAPGNQAFYLHAQHIRGLFNYYLSQAQQNEQATTNLMDSARSCYDRIVGYNDGYFDSLRREGMLVNLETILGNSDTVLSSKPSYLHARLIDSKSSEPVAGALVRIPNGPDLSSDGEGLIFYRYDQAPQPTVPVQVTLRVQAEGYQTAGYVFQLHRDSVKVQELRIQPSDELNLQVSSTTDSWPIVEIPVVVHVVFSTDEMNISDEQIISQIKVLTQDYRRQNPDTVNTPEIWKNIASDTRITFTLAKRDPNGQTTSGITRTKTSVDAFSPSQNGVKFDSLGGVNAWPSNEYLNIWVCNLGMGILGYSTLPGGPPEIDGVVMGYKFFGTIGTVRPPFNGGRTCTNQVGNWLGLRHIWGDGPCGVDDDVDDTPEFDRPHYGCPDSPTYSCDGGIAMQNNFMDYVDDACMNFFTLGQAQKIRQLFLSEGMRHSLLTSKALIPAEN